MLLSINLPHRLKKVSNFRRTAQKADDTLAHSAQFFKLMKSIIWNIQNEILVTKQLFRQNYRCRTADRTVIFRPSVPKYAPAHTHFCHFIQVVGLHGNACLVPSQLLHHSAGAVRQKRCAVERQCRGLLLVCLLYTSDAADD